MRAAGGGGLEEEWVRRFGIPTQFSPHCAARMAMAEPTAGTRLIMSDDGTGVRTSTGRPVGESGGGAAALPTSNKEV
jgi:hypothetical protein